MKISGIHLKNFKRFTDLTIAEIPTTAKLVLLIGSNGSGKSSVFDAFELINGTNKNDSPTMFSKLDDNVWSYFTKQKMIPPVVNIIFDSGKRVTIDNVGQDIEDLPPHSFYGRTSFRQVPRLTRTALGQGGKVNLEKDSDRPRFFIDRDDRFENDIEKITETILKDFFRSQKSNEQIRYEYINPINSALANIFGSEKGTKLQLLEIIPPLEGKVAEITFKKGVSEIQYNYLSAGEKEVFNLLINLLSRASYYQDTIYFLDEIDLHLNTQLQFNLLKEITENWIPENCQLWTASHSLGFIEYANKSEHAVIIDFDDLDFDAPHTLLPQPKDRFDVYEIAVPKDLLSTLFEHQNIYFAEREDANFYNAIGIAKTIFIPVNNRNDVYHKVRTLPYYGIVDRDFLSDDDILEIRKAYPHLCVLDYYCIENYLYHPDNLEAYYASHQKAFDREAYISALTTIKNQVKTTIIPSLALKRTAYPYFGEPEYSNKQQATEQANFLPNRFKNKSENEKQAAVIGDYLNSDTFEIYYKMFSMKNYATQLSQRQNVSRNELVRTPWFKTNIENVLAK